MSDGSGIVSVAPAEFERLTEIWEASVRATHHFLGEADIVQLRPRVRHDYLPMVELRACKNAAAGIEGFVGVADGKIEMLFIAPESRGRGVGKKLLACALDTLGATEVDVNEQNPQATGFYLHQGFEIVGRSPLDGQGNPFPLLHLRLQAARV